VQSGGTEGAWGRRGSLGAPRESEGQGLKRPWGAERSAGVQAPVGPGPPKRGGGLSRVGSPSGVPAAFLRGPCAGKKFSIFFLLRKGKTRPRTALQGRQTYYGLM